MLLAAKSVPPLKLGTAVRHRQSLERTAPEKGQQLLKPIGPAVLNWVQVTHHTLSRPRQPSPHTGRGTGLLGFLEGKNIPSTGGFEVQEGASRSLPLAWADISLLLAKIEFTSSRTTAAPLP